MKEFQQRRLFRRIFFSRAVFALFLCTAVLLGFSVYGVYKKSLHARVKNEKVVKEIEEMSKRKEKLGTSMAKLSTETGLEKELRGKFQLKKPGEEYVVILTPMPSDDIVGVGEGIGDPTSLKASTGKSFFEKFIEFFDMF